MEILPQLRRAHGRGRGQMMIGLYIPIGLFVFRVWMMVFAALRGFSAADEHARTLKEENDGEHEQDAGDSGH